MKQETKKGLLLITGVLLLAIGFFLEVSNPTVFHIFLGFVFLSVYTVFFTPSIKVEDYREEENKEKVEKYNK